MLKVPQIKLLRLIVVCATAIVIVGNLYAEELLIHEWHILGAFPNQLKTTPAGICPREGFDRDYLTDLGGESKAVINSDTVVKYKDQSGIELEARAVKIKREKGQIIDFTKIFPESDLKTAYAYAFFKADKNQEIFFDFGSDDSAKIWINGVKVHEKEVKTRDINRSSDRFKAMLTQGENRILVKVENGSGGWSFILENMDAETTARRDNARELQNCNIFPKYGEFYSFHKENFPELTWNASENVKKVLGINEPKIQWFNDKLQKVEKAETVGRYIAYVEITGANGIKFRRAVTFCRTPDDMRPWNIDPEVSMGPPKTGGISPEAWKSHRTAINTSAQGIMSDALFEMEGGAILLNYVLTMKECDAPASTIDNPWIANAEAQLALKRQLVGIKPDTYKPLQPPETTAEAVPMLHPGTETEAGMKPETIANLKKICLAWAADGETPFVALVARNGVVFFHEAFGNVSRERKFDAASITKAVSGMLFAQFMEQGLMMPDDPIGKYLPDFPTSGDKLITMRNCLTHTTGLNGHFEWGGVHNPWLDNVIANNLDALTPNQVYNYNGMGFDLAGKAMEITSGKSVLRLFQENIFRPLDIKNVYQWDMACAMGLSAEDLGKLGQMLLNRGSYGKTRFFSPEVFEQIKPQKLSNYYPSVSETYGFGLSHMTTKDPDTGKNGIQERFILSENIIGHGAASSSVFRADPDHNLVIIVARNTDGKNFPQHLAKFLKAIEAGLN